MPRLLLFLREYILLSLKGLLNSWDVLFRLWQYCAVFDIHRFRTLLSGIRIDPSSNIIVLNKRPVERHERPPNQNITLNSAVHKLPQPVDDKAVCQALKRKRKGEDRVPEKATPAS